MEVAPRLFHPEEEVLTVLFLEFERGECEVCPRCGGFWVLRSHRYALQCLQNMAHPDWDMVGDQCQFCLGWTYFNRETGRKSFRGVKRVYGAREPHFFVGGSRLWVREAKRWLLMLPELPGTTQGMVHGGQIRLAPWTWREEEVLQEYLGLLSEYEPPHEGRREGRPIPIGVQVPVHMRLPYVEYLTYPPMGIPDVEVADIPLELPQMWYQGRMLSYPREGGLDLLLDPEDQNNPLTGGYEIRPRPPNSPGVRNGGAQSPNPSPPSSHAGSRGWVPRRVHGWGVPVPEDPDTPYTGGWGPSTPRTTGGVDIPSSSNSPPMENAGVRGWTPPPLYGWAPPGARDLNYRPVCSPNGGMEGESYDAPDDESENSPGDVASRSNSSPGGGLWLPPS